MFCRFIIIIIIIILPNAIDRMIIIGKGAFSSGFQGGVHICSTAKDVREVASKMIGSNLVTKQTTAEGRPCSYRMATTALRTRQVNSAQVAAQSWGEKKHQHGLELL